MQMIEDAWRVRVLEMWFSGISLSVIIIMWQIKLSKLGVVKDAKPPVGQKTHDTRYPFRRDI